MRNRFLLLMVALFLSPSSAKSEPMRFELQGTGGNCNGCEWLHAKGEITADSAERLEAYLKKEKLTDWKGSVRLESPGGSLIGGIKLGEYFRKRGFSTEIGGAQTTDTTKNWPHERTKGDCVSSCTFAFLGGVERWFREGDGNRIGVHQFYDLSALANPSAKVFTSIDFSAQQLVSAMVVDYVMRMGVDPRLVVIASNTLPIDMHYLTQNEADELKVSWEPRKFEPWGIETYGSGIVAFSKTRDRRTTVTLFCRGDKTPRALVTFPAIVDATNYLSLFDMVDAVNAFGVTVPKEKMTLKYKDGTLRWDLALTGVKLDEMTKSATIEPAEYVHVVWDSFAFQPSDTNLTQAARAAFKNCI